MKKYAVIVAGGAGRRMGGGIPKQFRNLSGRPVLWWSMKAFHDEDSETQLILVLPEEFISLWEDFYSSLPDEDRFPYLTATGGNTRTASVRKGLSRITVDNSLVAIHDGARPLVSPEMISRGWEKARERGSAVPVVPVSDSLRQLFGEESQCVDRSDFVAVQTPQIFSGNLLKEAYDNAGEQVFTDDASVVENLGHKVDLYEGSVENIKITNPKDIEIATVMMSQNA